MKKMKKNNSSGCLKDCKMNKSLFLLSILFSLSACSPKADNHFRQPENNQVEVISAEIVDKSNEKDAFGVASIYAEDNRPPLEIRTAAFKKIAEDTKGLDKVVNGEAPYDPDQFLEQVVEFFGDAHEPFHYFEAQMPPDDKRGNAKPEIWTDEDGFFEEQVKFAENTSALLEATITDDLNKIKPAWATLKNSCQSCHDGYREKLNK